MTAAPPATAPKLGRFKELDGLRGLAALAVFVGHATHSYDELYVGAPASPFEVTWGAFGVQLFFMISGFVILMSAQRARRPSDFVISRVSRLYPAYWVALTLSIVLSVAFAVPTSDIGWVNRILNYVMVQRWFLIPNQDPVYWTLAIEMQFYVMVFLLLLLTRCRLSTRAVSIAAGAWMAVGLAVSVWARPHTLGLDPQLVDTPIKVVLNVTLAEWSALFSAGMFAFLSRRDARLRWAAIASAALAVLFGGLMHGTGYAIADTIVVLIFLTVALRERTGILLWRPIQFYGRISYSLYITHWFAGSIIMYLTMPFVGRLGAMAVAFAAVTLLAWGCYEVAEVRLSRMFKAQLERWRARRLAHGAAR